MLDASICLYFYSSNESLKVITDIIIQKDPTLILCIGAPSVYEELKSKEMMKKSRQVLVLDIDIRLSQFLSKEEFCHYNMFNHHFFDTESFETYKNIISKEQKTVLAITDPPFGGRPELLANTFQKLQKEINFETFHILWIFPYFMEPKLKNAMPSLNMSDYQVTYQQIGSYKQGQQGHRNQGSPVRIFTNIPLEEINLKNLSNQYRFCQTCRRYVAQTNRHCHECQNCTAKNGGLYRHCYECSRCVKFSWIHCKVCQRCALPDHPCELFCQKRKIQISNGK